MIKSRFFIVLIMSFGVSSLCAQKQRSPYTLSPEWRFGNNAGLSFPENESVFSTSSSLNPANQNPESSTGICDTQSLIALFTDTRIVYKSNGTVLRNIESVDGIAGASATEGGVAIPDPASPYNSYYLFIANDITGGAKQFNGINYYKLKRNNAGTLVVNSGPINLIGGSTPKNIANSKVDEALTSATDGAGNYWLIARSNAAARFHVWQITATGIGGRSDYNVNNTPTTSTAQSSLKINQCQNKLAWSGGNFVRVYSFNKSTGAIGATPLYRNPGGADYLFNKTPYEVEFSPDGSKLYVSSMHLSQLAQIDLNGAAGNGTVISTDEIWGLQLGPDGNIYGTKTPGSSDLIVISNPNSSAPSLSTMSLQSGSSIYRGITNIAFLSPNQPIISQSVTGSTVSFNYKLRTYFNDTITVLPGSEVWDFGDGSPVVTGVHHTSHTYHAAGPFFATLTFKDNVCQEQWRDTVEVIPNIPLPVVFKKFRGYIINSKVNLMWSAFNNERVAIYKSIDGLYFEKIGETSANQFVDESKVGGYYRLKLVNDKNGYSDLIFVDMENQNPYYTIKNEQVVFNGVLYYEIYTYDGKLIKRGDSSFLLNELEKGFYLIHMLTEDNNIINDKIISR